MPNNRKIKKKRGGEKPIWMPSFIQDMHNSPITTEKIIQVLTEMYELGRSK